MWAYTCGKCHKRQLFGVRRIVGFDTLARGVVAVRWSCPNCGHQNTFMSGSAVTQHLGSDGVVVEAR